jgi:hypothetical protein
MKTDSGLSPAVVFAVAVPVMLYETGARVTVVQADDLYPGTAAVQDRGLVRVARGDCSSLSSLMPVLRLAGALYRWHALPNSARLVLQIEADSVRAKGDARAAFYQSSDAEIVVGRALRGEGSDDPERDRIMRQLAAPESMKGGWLDAFAAVPVMMFVLPFAYIDAAFRIAYGGYSR